MGIEFDDKHQLLLIIEGIGHRAGMARMQKGSWSYPSEYPYALRRRDALGATKGIGRHQGPPS